jgi:hypothetical protein
VKPDLFRRADSAISDSTRLVGLIVTLLKYISTTLDGIKYGWVNIIAKLDNATDMLGFDSLSDPIDTNVWDAAGLVSNVLMGPFTAQRNLFNFKMRKIRNLSLMGCSSSKRDFKDGITIRNYSDDLGKG